MNKVPHARTLSIRPNLLTAAADLLLASKNTTADPGPAGVRDALTQAAIHDADIPTGGIDTAVDNAWRHIDHLWIREYGWYPFGSPVGWAAMLRYAATVPAGK
jgi:hypothetical protein